MFQQVINTWIESKLRVKQEKAIIKGLKAYYIKTGKGPSLLFLHGLFSHVREYHRLFALLQNHFTVYALDLPGFGPSQQPPRPYSVEDYSSFVLAFMKKMKIKKAVLMAHSAGGIVAIDLALRHKEKVAKLILIDSAGLKHKYSTPDLFYQIFVVKALRELKHSKDWRESLSLIAGIGYDLAVHPFRKNLWKSISKNVNVSYEEKLCKLEVPTVIIWGKNDELLPLKNARKFRSLIKNSRLVMLDGNHDWPLLCPEKHWKKIKPKLI